MLDIKLLRDDPALVKESQRRRFQPESDVDDVIDLDRQWRTAQFNLEKKSADINKIEKEIAKLLRTNGDSANLLAEKGALENEHTELKLRASKLKLELDSKLKSLGNLVHDSVPVSSNEKDKVVVTKWGVPRQDQEALENHVSLCKKLDAVDVERGAAVAGHRGYYLLDPGFELNMALVNFGLKFLKDRGYRKIQTPTLMDKAVMKCCAQLSQFDEELYELAGEGKYLIATSEQALCGYLKDKNVAPESLPLRYAGYSSCFRKEAGSHGKDTLGIFRVHEFQKVEQFCVTAPETSWDMLEEMIKTSEDFYQQLGLPYQVVNVVSGELNDAAAKKYDLEAWFPAAGKYEELVSCSNCTDYQARSLNIKSGKKLVHLLNCTLVATQRTMCCIVENYQTRNGVRVPEVLQPFMDGTTFLPFPK
ncbi:hypothetical protein SELMODRAFT_414448 [Selaginella moellendorffii]|uniref:serine--tRNA ligase n=1 Tax=Selaginella moellendorffii TaxID=88036 RepID=D8RST3_SELML|nr:serine--tRNA ligase [Selaginella moellendorffii]EFJ24918.1 hypothetical protein SELMODRAFT_414448 [Selaginella moellendorffii]|eukprot:XP_002973963.1 serine--tRNA ligase [Selaginella moellendorffii]